MFSSYTLVYDDDAVAGLELVQLLRNAGFDKVQFTAHYEPALRALETQSTIDLLIADVVVPNGLNGIALARMACLRQPLISIMLVTGYSVGPVERRLGWPILQKPVSDDLLISEVSHALEFPPNSGSPLSPT